jgi:hypothetical protein
MTDMERTSDIAPWPGTGTGKGFLASNDSNEWAIEVWKTDQAGVPTHGEVLVAREYPVDDVLAFFTIDDRRLLVHIADDRIRQRVHRAIVEREPRLGELELQEGWDFA